MVKFLFGLDDDNNIASNQLLVDAIIHDPQNAFINPPYSPISTIIVPNSSTLATAS